MEGALALMIFPWRIRDLDPPQNKIKVLNKK
jgi:hypothetical protein